MDIREQFQEQYRHQKQMRRIMRRDTIESIWQAATLAMICAFLTILLSCTHPNPPGVDPENYDYATSAEIDSIWRAEVGSGGVFR